MATLARISQEIVSPRIRLLSSTPDNGVTNPKTPTRLALWRRNRKIHRIKQTPRHDEPLVQHGNQRIGGQRESRLPFNRETEDSEHRQAQGCLPEQDLVRMQVVHEPLEDNRSHPQQNGAQQYQKIPEQSGGTLKIEIVEKEQHHSAERHG